MLLRMERPELMSETMRQYRRRTASKMLALLVVVVCGHQGHALDTLRHTLTRIDGHFRGALRISKESAVVFGTNGNVVTTTDKGATWNQVPGVPLVTVTAGVALDGNLCLLFTNDGRVFRVRVREAVFDTLPSADNILQSVTRCCRLSKNEILCGDSYGTTYRYTIGDTVLVSDTELSGYNVQCMASIGPGIVFVGTTTGVLRSVDSGRTWKLVQRGESPHEQALSFIGTEDDSLVVSFCDDAQTEQRLYVTGDGGTTWRKSVAVHPVVGSLLGYDKGVCTVLNIRQGRQATCVRLPEAFTAPVSVAEYGWKDTSKYVTAETIRSGLSFDESVVLLVGDHKTMYRSINGGTDLQLLSAFPPIPGTPKIDYMYIGAHDDTTLSWAGMDQRYVSSHDAGATWIPRAKSTQWKSVGIYPKELRLLSPECFIGASNLRRLDITTDGGRTFSHPGMYESDGTVFMDSWSSTAILSADSIVKSTDLGLAVVTDSCRKWDLRRSLQRYSYRGDSVLVEQSIDIVQPLAPYVFVWVAYWETDLTSGLMDRSKERQVVLRTKDFLKTADTVLRFNRVGGLFGMRVIRDTKLVCEYKGIQYVTGDYGDTWDTIVGVSLPKELWLQIPPDSFFIYGEKDSYLVTFDSARTWSILPRPAIDRGLDFYLFASSKRRLFLYAKNSVESGLYRLDFVRDSGIVQSVEPSEAERPSPIRLRMAKMHPFRARATIGLRVDDTVPLVDIHLGVYDLQGNLVSDLTDRLRQTTTVKDDERIIEWDAESVSRGIYYIVARTAGRSVSLPVLKAE